MNTLHRHELSLRVVWLFCTGMCFNDPYKQAEYDLAKFLRLPPGSIETPGDVETLSRCLEGYARHLPGDTIASATVALQASHPAFRAAFATAA